MTEQDRSPNPHAFHNSRFLGKGDRSHQHLNKAEAQGKSMPVLLDNRKSTFQARGFSYKVAVVSIMHVLSPEFFLLKQS